MGRENTKRYSNKTSLAGVAGSNLEPTKTQSNADVSSKESGNLSNDQKGAVGVYLDIGKTGFYQTNLQEKKIEPRKDAGFNIFQWLADPLGWNTAKNPTVNPQTQNQDTNQLDSEKMPDVNNGANNQANSDVQIDQTNVSSVPEKNVLPVHPDDADKYNGSGRFDNGSDNGTGYAQPNITYINDAIDRQNANMDKIASQMQANMELQKAYADKVNTSLMSEINGLYEANGKQNELNDLIIDATNQKWMTQLGDEIVPIQSQNAFKQPLPLKQFDVSSITGSPYFIFIVVGIIALIGLSMLKGKGSGSGTGVNVTRYG